MNPFEFKSTYLLSIVNDGFYSVPRYQRSYAWEKDKVADFWADMHDAIEGTREHFLGTIVLTTDSKDGTRSIVDGQQRLVTTTILLAAMRNQYKRQNDNKSADAFERFLSQHDLESYEDAPRIRMNPEDHPFYESRILRACPRSP